MNYRALYDAETAKLQALADSVYAHPKDLCINLKDYPNEMIDRVAKILRVQVDLLIKINRQTPLPYIKGPQ